MKNKFMGRVETKYRTLLQIINFFNLKCWKTVWKNAAKKYWQIKPPRVINVYIKTLNIHYNDLHKI